MIILMITMFLVILLGANEIARRYPSLAAFLFLLVPILLIPWGIYHNVHYDWFWWMKTYSVFIAIGLILAMRFTRFNQMHYAPYALWLILGLNILEAAVEGITHGYAEVGYVMPIMNAFVGLLLIMTIPSTTLIKVDNTPPKDFIWTIPLGWIIGYTIWNATFAYVTFPDASLRQVAVLLAPLILECYRRGLWFQTRAFTLGAYLLLRFIHEPMMNGFVVSNFYHPYIAQPLTALGVVWMSGYMVWYLYQHRLPIRTFIAYEWSRLRESQ